MEDKQINTKYKLTDFWFSLNFKPREFFSRFTGFEKAPYLLAVIFIVGISASIDRIERQLVKYDAQGKLDQLSFLNEWSVFWALGIALGIAFGYLAYYLGGWFFNLRIKWSKGEPNKEKARFIYLYTLLVPGFLHLLFTISSFIIDPKPFISETDVSIKELIQGFVLILANFYSVYVSYIGATTAFNPRKGLAILWFLFLPMLFYALALLAFVGLILLMAMKDI